MKKTIGHKNATTTKSQGPQVELSGLRLYMIGAIKHPMAIYPNIIKTIQYQAIFYS